MKKFITLSLVFLTLSPLAPAEGASKAPAEKVFTLAQLSGNLLLEKNSDRIWYAEPVKRTRYIIRDDADITWLRDNLTAAITSADFAKMPIADSVASKKYTGKYNGRLVRASPDPNDAWYISPATGKRYQMLTFATMQKLAKETGITVGPKSLAKLAMTKKQVMFDPVATPLGYVRYDGERFSGGKNAKTILPLASLTKLMTALVLLDTNIDFEKTVIVTSEEINYPKTLVGDDATSEVNLQSGDQVLKRLIPLLHAQSMHDNDDLSVFFDRDIPLSFSEVAGLGRIRVKG